LNLRQKLLIGVLCLIVGLAGMYFTRLEDEKQPSIQREEGNALVMNTFGNIVVYGENNLQEIIAAGFKEADRIADLVDRFNPQSDVYKINASGGEWVKVAPEVLDLIETAIYWSKKTEGAFDPTITPLVELWGFIENDESGPNGFNVPGKKPPSPESIEEALKKVVGVDAIEIDREKSQIRIAGGGQIDLGGIAKGYAADLVYEMMKTKGIKAGMVNFGGDMVIKGLKDNGEVWKVGILHPRDPSKPLAVLFLTDVGLVTSGDYERFFEYEGVRYHHIINPATGYPGTELISATIIAPSGVAADAVATAVFSMRLQKSLQFLESLPGVDGVLVDKDQNVHVTSGLTDKYTLF
jgi:thiamine biosynthesis lipoprotein